MTPTRMARVATLLGYFGLFILVVAWNAWLSPPTRLPITLVLLVLGTPLLLPLRGLLHGRPYTHAWTSYLALAYFAHGVVQAYAVPPERVLGLLEIFFSLLLFTGAIFYARLRTRELRQVPQDSRGS